MLAEECDSNDCLLERTDLRTENERLRATIKKMVSEDAGTIMARVGERDECEESLDTYWQALYAIRCSAEHVDVVSKRANGKRVRAVLGRTLDDMNNIRRIADEAIVAVKGDQHGRS